MWQENEGNVSSRYSCYELLDPSVVLAMDPDYFMNLGAALDHDCAVHFYNFLLQRKEPWDPQRIPSTPWLQMLQATDQPVAAAFLQDQIEAGSLPASPTPTQLWDMFMGWAAGHGRSYLFRSPSNYTDREFSLDLGSYCGVYSRTTSKGSNKVRTYFFAKVGSKIGGAPLTVKQVETLIRAAAPSDEFLVTPLGDVPFPRLRGNLLHAVRRPWLMRGKKVWAIPPDDDAGLDTRAPVDAAAFPKPPAPMPAAVLGGTARPRGAESPLPPGLRVDPQQGDLCALHALRNATQDFDAFSLEMLVAGALAAASRLGDPLTRHTDQPIPGNFSTEAIVDAVGSSAAYTLENVPNICCGLDEKGADA